MLREFLFGLRVFKDDLETEVKEGMMTVDGKRRGDVRRAELEAQDKGDCYLPGEFNFKGGRMVHTCQNKYAEVGRPDTQVVPAKDKKVEEEDAKKGDNPFEAKAHTAKSGLLCYPPCKKDYSGFGPLCFTKCPADFKDHGLFCYKPDGHWRADGGECEENEHRTMFGKWCSRNCPSGMSDISISCTKSSYFRGLGSVLGCAEDEH